MLSLIMGEIEIRQTGRKQENVCKFKSWNVVRPLKSMLNEKCFITGKMHMHMFSQNQNIKCYVQYFLNSFICRERTERENAQLLVSANKLLIISG